MMQKVTCPECGKEISIETGKPRLLTLKEAVEQPDPVWFDLRELRPIRVAEITQVKGSENIRVLYIGNGAPEYFRASGCGSIYRLWSLEKKPTEGENKGLCPRTHTDP